MIREIVSKLPTISLPYLKYLGRHFYQQDFNFALALSGIVMWPSLGLKDIAVLAAAQHAWWWRGWGPQRHGSGPDSRAALVASRAAGYRTGYDPGYGMTDTGPIPIPNFQVSFHHNITYKKKGQKIKKKINPLTLFFFAHYRKQTKNF